MRATLTTSTYLNLQRRYFQIRSRSLVRRGGTSAYLLGETINSTRNTYQLLNRTTQNCCDLAAFNVQQCQFLYALTAGGGRGVGVWCLTMAMGPERPNHRIPGRAVHTETLGAAPLSPWGICPEVSSPPALTIALHGQFLPLI